MKYDSRVLHRRSIRMRDYDYRTTGAYFVTVCTHERLCIFEDAELKSVAEEVWRIVVGASGRFIDDFIVMPNHVHGIVWIGDPTVVGARQPGGSFEKAKTLMNVIPNTNGAVASPLRAAGGPRSGAPGYVAGSPLRTAFGPPSGSLGAIVGSFKAATAKRINNIRRTPGNPLWQRNYYEHIIRNQDDLARIRQYIRNNRAKWADDPDNPANVPTPS